MCLDENRSTYRALSEAELAFLEKLTSADFEGAEVLRDQVRQTQVAAIDLNGSLRLRPGDAVAAAIKHRIPVEASYPDPDGGVVHVLLHVIDGRLHELEIYREDSGRVLIPAIEPTDFGSFSVTSFPPSAIGPVPRVLD
jgi:hypothetical protein